MSAFDDLSQLLVSLEARGIPVRLDRHAHDQITATFVYEHHCIEAYFELETEPLYSIFKEEGEIRHDLDGLEAYVVERWY